MKIVSRFGHKNEFHAQMICFNVNFKFLDIADDNGRHDVCFDSFSKSLTLPKDLKNSRFINNMHKKC